MTHLTLPYPTAVIRAAVDFLILDRDTARLLAHWETLHAEYPLGEATGAARSAYSLSAGERNQARRRLLIYCGQDAPRADALCALLRPLQTAPSAPDSEDPPPEVDAPEGTNPPAHPPAAPASAGVPIMAGAR